MNMVIIDPDTLVSMIEDAVARAMSARIEEDDRWMTRAEMLAHLGCSKATLARKVKAGEVEKVGAGQDTLYGVKT